MGDCSMGASGTGELDHSVLWNAMIYPFLNMTIKGAIWYQGESNAGIHSTKAEIPPVESCTSVMNSVKF